MRVIVFAVFAAQAHRNPASRSPSVRHSSSSGAVKIARSKRNRSGSRLANIEHTCE
jgi:hypothetical protein